ncbi:soluble guanylate cyclase gcy-31-like [Saccostrea echinata]|uniref:soluble guanylate cyclase gcy-31-like n=1 Tax=Saccostrea echinata TaxID=191078 RepID=UPI002A820BD0|nr:soluble guanylate cyclase gcy-31-like [Saccostrea echinata]
MDKSSLSLGSFAIPSLTLHGKGNICHTVPLSDRGKRVQMVKMLGLTVLPILALWSYCVYQLTDLISTKTDNEKMRESLKFSIEIGRLIHHLQKERDLSILYLSALGPETKLFLLKEYEITDKAIESIARWPGNLDRDNSEAFESKGKMMQHLVQHRQQLNRQSSDINKEMQFYTSIIDIIIYWGYKSIEESKFAVVWKSLVGFQKITSAKEDMGLERALGTMFFARGGFETHLQFEEYNMKIFGFQTNYKTARLYSSDVDYIGSYGIFSYGKNVSIIMNTYRTHILNNGEEEQSVSKIDLRNARWFYDNATLYLDKLLDLQTTLGNICLGKVDKILEDSNKDLIISACVLVFVLIACSIVIISTENLTSSIQKYVVILVDKTKELNFEKKRTDSLLYQMVPKEVADKLKKKEGIEAEYFKSVTVLFSDIHEFSRLSISLQPLEIVQLLNALYGAIDFLLDNRDLYKVETINDSYMVASGLPHRNNNRHADEIADFSLAVQRMMKERTFSNSEKGTIQLRIGINTGPCMAGIVGSTLPRYCLFGDTVNTASRMKSHSRPNKINISHTTYVLLSKTGNYTMKKRGTINIKGKGEMKTYWLTGCTLSGDIIAGSPTSYKSFNNDLPGEITHSQYSYMALSYNPLPGRKLTEDQKNKARVSPNDVNNVAMKKKSIAKRNTKSLFPDKTERKVNGNGESKQQVELELQDTSAATVDQDIPTNTGQSTA